MSSMAAKKLSVRVPFPLIQQFECYIHQKGLTISEGVLAVIASYVGDNERLPLVERVSRLEKKLAQLEGQRN